MSSMVADRARRADPAECQAAPGVWLAVRRRLADSPRGMPRQRLALAVLLTASFTLAVDFSILNVALPAIGADVGLALAHLQWIATSFALCAAGFTLLFGRVADLFGRRRAVPGRHGAARRRPRSWAGSRTTPALLLAARAGQGLATAAVIPAALSLLTTTFPEGPLRERALGLNGALMAAGFTTGAIARRPARPTCSAGAGRSSSTSAWPRRCWRSRPSC